MAIQGKLLEKFQRFLIVFKPESQSNPNYPSVEKVRDEIIQMMKGLLCSAIFPSMALHFAGTPLSQAFCGWGDYSWQYHLASLLLVWIGSDFYEFLYHRLGHVDYNFWQQVSFKLGKICCIIMAQRVSCYSYVCKSPIKRDGGHSNFQKEMKVH